MKRYIDDVIIFNQPTVAQLLKDIYGNIMEWTATEFAKNANFLDVNINLLNSKIELNVYNKTNDFAFEVVRFSQLDSNVADTVHKNIISSQLLRCLRISNNIYNLIDVSRALCKCYQNRGFKIKSLREICSFVYNTHVCYFSKFMFPTRTNIDRVIASVVNSWPTKFSSCCLGNTGIIK